MSSTRPSLDVNIDIFHDLYRVSRDRWDIVLFLTDDPGPNQGTITIYGSMAEVAEHYPAYSLTYRAIDQFFDQPNVDDIWIMPITPSVDGSPPALLDWTDAINTEIVTNGLSWLYTIASTCKGTEVAEIADTINNFAAVFFGRHYEGDRATLTTGADLTEIVYTARRYGVFGNKCKIHMVDPGEASQDLAVTTLANAGDGYDIVISLATDVGSAITSTPATIVAAIVAHEEASFLVFAVGAGTSAVSAEALTPLAGGGENEAPIGDFGTILETANDDQFMGFMHSSEAMYPDIMAAALGSTMNPGSYTMKNRIINGAPEAKYTPTERVAQRSANINSIYTSYAGHVCFTDSFMSSGLYLDIQLAIFVLQHWMKLGIQDLMDQPPPGYHKVPYDNDGFAMIMDKVVGALTAGSRPEWNFIVSRGGEPAIRVHMPTFVQCSETNRKNRVYECWWEATFKGAIHEVDVTGYLTIEFIPPTEQRLGTGITFKYD